MTWCDWEAVYIPLPHLFSMEIFDQSQYINFQGNSLGIFPGNFFFQEFFSMEFFPGKFLANQNPAFSRENVTLEKKVNFSNQVILVKRA